MHVFYADHLGQPEHQVHGLNRLTGRSLHQIVDDRKDQYGVSTAQAIHRDSAVVGTTDRTCIRMPVWRKHNRERFGRVAFLVERSQIDLLGQSCV